MTENKITIGSRGSALAMIQSEWVADSLRKAWPGLTVEIKRIVTQGDRITDVPLSQVGIKGIFTRELDLAQVKEEIDIAVHSMKDVPTELFAGLSLAAVTKREQPNDVLISRDDRSFDELPMDAKIGTSSLRRKAQLLAAGKNLEVVDIRGNIDTRLRKLDGEEVDAIVLASAGLVRLNIKRPVFIFPSDQMLPAPGQGALAITARLEDKEAMKLLNPLHDTSSAECVRMERDLLARLGGGCQAPFGALAENNPDGSFTLEVALFSTDGSESIRARAKGMNPSHICDAVYDEMDEKGLNDLLASIAM